MAIAQLNLLVINLPLIVFYRALILFDGLLLIFERLASERIARHRLLIAGQVKLRLLQQSLIVLQGAFRLFELGLIRPGVDFDQRLTLADHLSFAIIDSDHFSGDLSVDADGREGGDRSQSIDMNPDVSFADGRGFDVHDRGLIQCILGGLRLGLVYEGKNDNQDQQADEENPYPGSPFSRGGRGRGEWVGMQARFRTLHAFGAPADNVAVVVSLNQYANSLPARSVPCGRCPFTDARMLYSSSVWA